MDSFVMFVQLLLGFGELWLKLVRTMESKHIIDIRALADFLPLSVSMFV
jgi:hypothetical protein